MYELAAICDTCKQQINDNDGHLYAPYTEIRAHYNDDLPTIALGGVEDVISQQMPIHWRVQHYACTPPEYQAETLYQIEVEQIRTWARLAEWTRQLSSKTWAARSDWAALVMACALARRVRITQAFALSTGA